MSDLIEIYNGTCMFCMQCALIKPVGHRDEHEYCDCVGYKDYHQAKQLLSGLGGVAARNLERTQSKQRLTALKHEVNRLEDRLVQLGSSDKDITVGTLPKKEAVKVETELKNNSVGMRGLSERLKNVNGQHMICLKNGGTLVSFVEYLVCNTSDVLWQGCVELVLARDPITNVKFKDGFISPIFRIEIPKDLRASDVDEARQKLVAAVVKYSRLDKAWGYIMETALPKAPITRTTQAESIVDSQSSCATHDLCKCGCHSADGKIVVMMHCFPCCSKCPKCGQNVLE